MENQNTKISLKDKWSNFVNIILDPWVIILLVITLFINYFFSQKKDSNTLTILSIIITLISGLLGGVIANKWSEMTELKVLVARGKSAIRSLKLILLNVSNIEKRTKEYIEILEKDNKEYKLIRCNFEEFIEKCNVIEEEILSSIENWTDIIPEIANFKTDIGLITELKIKEEILNNDIQNLNKVKGESGIEKEELMKQLKTKENELLDTKRKLIEKENRFNSTVLSGLTTSSISPRSSLDINRLYTQQEIYTTEELSHLNIGLKLSENSTKIYFSNNL